MIKCEQLWVKKYTCNNCYREMPLILHYTFADSVKIESFEIQGIRHTELNLCEDCSNAIANLHYKVMKTGNPHKYDMDEITEVKK